MPENSNEISESLNESIKKLNEQIQKLNETIEKLKIIQTFDSGVQNPSPCDACSNSPKNGGSGICHCTLGTQTFY